MHIGIKIATGVLSGVGFFAMCGPILGEMFATMAPIRTKRDFDLVMRLGIPYEEVSFPTQGGLTLRGWFFPAKQADSPAVLYAPATTNDQISGLPLVAPLHAAGYHVLLFSYHGHGRSDGSRFAFTYGAAESLEVDAGVRYLSEERGIRKIGVIGHSSGAVSVILSAARNPRIGAVIAMAPFTSLEEVWETNRPPFFPKFLSDFAMTIAEMRKGFSRRQIYPEAVIAQIAPRSLLLVFGSNDRFIRQDQAMRLFEAAREPKSMWLMEGAGHSQVRAVVMEQLTPEIITFLDAALRTEHAMSKRSPRQHTVTPDYLHGADTRRYYIIPLGYVVAEEGPIGSSEAGN